MSSKYKLKAVYERSRSESEVFITFPDWFSNSLATAHRNLLTALIVYFRIRTTDFDVSKIRSWIDQRKKYVATGSHSSSPIGKTGNTPRADVTLVALLLDELARIEYVANLSRKKGLDALEDSIFALGYSEQQMRRKGGRNSGRARRQAADDRASRIASYTLSLISGGHDRSQWARMAASAFTVSQRTAREAIKSSGLYDKSPFALPSDFLSRVKVKRNRKKSVKKQ